MPIHSFATDQRLIDKNYYRVAMMGAVKFGLTIYQAQAALPELLLQEGGSCLASATARRREMTMGKHSTGWYWRTGWNFDCILWNKLHYLVAGERTC